MDVTFQYSCKFMQKYINLIIQQKLSKILPTNKMSGIVEQQHTPEPNTFPVYSKQFILKPYIVMDHTNKSKKQMDDFIQAFSKRIDTQLTYQKNLNECAKMLEKYIDPTTEKCLSYISSAFKVDNQQRGNQARQLADSLRTQVIQPLRQSFGKFTNLSKKAEKNFKKLNKDYIYFMDKFKSSRQDFKNTDMELKQMLITKNIYKYTSQYSQDKKNKLVSKSMQGIKQKMEYEKNYRNSVNQLNQFVELYQKDAVQMLNQLQQIQREQIKLQSDAIRKLIVCQVSMFKNVEYDLINISKQMQKMYAQNDIQQFKKQAVAAITNEQDKDFKDFKDMNLKAIQFDKSLESLSLKNVQQDYYSWLLMIKKNKALRKIMQIRMKQINNDQSSKKQQKKQSSQTVSTEQPQKTQKPNISKQTAKQQQIKQGVPQNIVNTNQNTNENYLENQWKNLSKQFFNPPPNPNGTVQKLVPKQSLQDFNDISQMINKVWSKGQQLQTDTKNSFIQLLQKNHLNRILAYLFIQEYRIEHKVLMSWICYEKAGQLSKTIIDTCQKFNDVFTLKGLLALIFTFYSIKDQKFKKLMYQIAIVNQCDIWKREDYWEASIFQSTYQQMVNFNVQKGQTHGETLLREKNIIFSQLASYCHYMLILGSSSKNVRRIVGRYCRLYEMSQQQNRDLSKMISNTTKQIKQISNQNTVPSSISSSNSVNSATTPTGTSNNETTQSQNTNNQQAVVTEVQQ